MFHKMSETGSPDAFVPRANFVQYLRADNLLRMIFQYHHSETVLEMFDSYLRQIVGVGRNHKDTKKRKEEEDGG